MRVDFNLVMQAKHIAIMFVQSTKVFNWKSNWHPKQTWKLVYFEGSNAGHETDFKRINLIWVQNFRVRQRRQGIRNRSSMTNCKSSSLFQIILNSMHRFQPRIYLVVRPEGANHPITDIEQEKYRTYIFPETIFTAVTAYQNQLVSF